MAKPGYNSSQFSYIFASSLSFLCSYFASQNIIHWTFIHNARHFFCVIPSLLSMLLVSSNEFSISDYIIHFSMLLPVCLIRCRCSVRYHLLSVEASLALYSN
ncbi:hypothetical protein BT96DRAFT_393000 [Gymnopus androsaceus JB14]|uniref:Uncharacterized protein n=1 Tax=Gymnopus androsaceus JB14 TaxID=1447944 RepID=A0A6A4GWC4_9AGAR|nr:hypothetical protein BT96DRAFT_393000 [Gymnopus androsaceus JB14]